MTIEDKIKLNLSEVHEAIKDLEAVLLDPSGYSSIEGSSEDNHIITSAMRTLKKFVEDSK